jgi:hypothetical protein
MEEKKKIKNIYEKLSEVQNELKAPKNQYNSFGKYNYRSCEDILEGVKPLCRKYRTTLIIGDTLELIGDRYYIKATAILYDLDSDKSISNTAYARESENKTGMDVSQITGATSSYARKYALNGLFNIDDTKDADTDEFQKTIGNEQEKKEVSRATDKQKEMIKKLYTREEIKTELETLKRAKLSDLTVFEASSLISRKKGGNENE